MAKPKFYLDSLNAKKEHPIILKYSFNGLRLKYYTGISIKKLNFQPHCNKGSAKPIKSIAPFSEQYNNKLLDMAISAVTIVNEARDENINVKYVRNELDKIFKPKEIKVKPADVNKVSFIVYFEQIIADSKSGKRLIKSGKNKGKRYTHNAIKNYGISLSALKRYMNYEKLKDLLFSDITPEFYEDFRSFCFDVEEKEISTFGGYIKDIKTVMIESKVSGFDKDAFYIPSYEADTIAYTLEQLDIIDNLDLSNQNKYITHLIVSRDKNGKAILDKKGNKVLKPEKIYYPVLDNIRDLSLIGCYSAMRFQNYNDLDIEAIENGFIRIKQKKTGNRTTIPIMKRLQKVLDKYKGGLPNSVSNQQFNRIIKLVVKLAGLDHTITVRQTKGNIEKYIEVPFYEMVSSHTARRTYATIMFKAGVPPLLIMSATGHTTEKSFLKYIRATNEDKARLLAETIQKLGL